MSLAADRIAQAARIAGRLHTHPLMPQDARVCVELLVLILGELDTRLTELERVNDGHGRQAR